VASPRMSQWLATLGRVETMQQKFPLRLPASSSFINSTAPYPLWETGNDVTTLD
jgi:hypothetical protein